jgi:DNA-binding XRE family transcriptional regulator
MSNHPNRGTSTEPPTPDEVREARLALGLTQEQAAAVVLHSKRAWEKWERAIGDDDHRDMHPIIWWAFKKRARAQKGST